MAIVNTMLKTDCPKKCKIFEFFNILVIKTERIKPRSRGTDKPTTVRSMASWSEFSDFLAIKLDCYPNYVFVIEMEMMTLHSMIATEKEIKDLEFKGNMMFFVWGTPHFAIWQDYTVAIANPFFGLKTFRCSRIAWSNDSRQMVIKSKGDLCLYYPGDEYRSYLVPSDSRTKEIRFSIDQQNKEARKSLLSAQNPNFDESRDLSTSFNKKISVTDMDESRDLGEITQSNIGDLDSNRMIQDYDFRQKTLEKQRIDLDDSHDNTANHFSGDTFSGRI